MRGERRVSGAAVFLGLDHVFAMSNDQSERDGENQRDDRHDQAGGKFGFIVSHEALQKSVAK